MPSNRVSGVTDASARAIRAQRTVSPADLHAKTKGAHHGSRSTRRSRTAPTSSVDIVDWRPEDNAFWESTGKKIASRNLWISVPSLLCGFASG